MFALRYRRWHLDEALAKINGEKQYSWCASLRIVGVFGLAEASCQTACELGSRFSIITGGERWPAMPGEFVAQIGLSGHLASIRAVAATGREIAANPSAAHQVLADACRSAAQNDGADVVILGGAGLVGIAKYIKDSVPVPLLCSVESRFRRAFAVMNDAFAKPADGNWAFPPAVETIGLQKALATALSAQNRAAV